MKKLPFILLLLFFGNIGYSQFKIDFEINSGSPGNQSFPSGFIEVGNDLVSIENTSGNNYSQTDLKIINKSTGSLIYSEVLSNSYDVYFNIKKAVTIEDHQGYFFVINISGYDYDSGNNINSFRLYNYTNNSLTLLNTFTNTKSDILYSASGDLYSIDASKLEIQKINSSNFSIEEQTPLSFSVNDFLSPNLLPDDDGNFILEAWEKVTNFSYVSYDVFLSKFNIEGQILWEKTIGGNSRDFILDMKIKNGDIYLCGESTSKDGIFADQYGSGVEWFDEPIKSNWVLKLNTNGEIVWNKLFGTISGDYSSKTGRFTNIFIEDDYLFVSGSTYNKYDYYENSNVDNQDVIAVKLDLEGNTIWKKSYGGFNNQIIQSTGVSNGQIIHTTNLERWFFLGGSGFYASQGDVSAETSGKFNNPLIYQTEGGSNQGDIWMFATNFDGEILWDNFYGGERDDRVSYSIYNSESIFMFGNTQSTGYDVGELLGYQDSWLFKLEPDNTTASVNDQNIYNNLIIYPNPTNSLLFIDGNEIPKFISVFNVLSQEVISTKNTNKIDLQALPSGMYVIRISDGVHQTNRKFIKN